MKKQYLYNHQQKIVDENKKKTGLWLGTGSGKTRTALLLARGSTLVIAPKMQVEDMNWQRELETLHSEFPIGYVSISKLTVISKETLRRDWDTLPAFDTIIVDEAHTCLGVTPNTRMRKKEEIPRTSQLFEALDLFIQKTDPERIYLCTATIVKNPMTVWGAAKILGKRWNWYDWRKAFYIKLPMAGREVWVPKRDNACKDRLAKAVQTIGYTGQLSDYFDVPNQTYKVEYVELTPKQKARIKELPFEYPDPIVLLGKKHQVENGILSADEFNPQERFANNKLERLLEFATEFPKMIIFAKYTAQIDQIVSAMEKTGKRVFALTGGTKDRGAVLSKANQCDNYVFIVQAQISAGWELPDCPVMVFASMSYSVVDRIQAEGRILRANKLKKNLYIDLITSAYEKKKSSVDQAVYDSIKNKEDFNERIYIKNELV